MVIRTKGNKIVKAVHYGKAIYFARGGSLSCFNADMLKKLNKWEDNQEETK